jgi:hypothetical protein
MDNHLSRPGECRRYLAYSILNSNPYNSPRKDSAMDEPNEMLSEESKANLRFAASIASVLSVVCIVGAIHTGFVAWRDIRDLNALYGEWTWIHYLTVIRTLFLPALIVFAWIAWQASGTMRDIGRAKSDGKLVDWNKHASSTTWLWIALTLFAVVSLFEMAARYSMLYFGGI